MQRIYENLSCDKIIVVKQGLIFVSSTHNLYSLLIVCSSINCMLVY